ncbi:hypothetical protein F4808DRAFT_463739, partial [Astrocystis sublimbata]
AGHPHQTGGVTLTLGVAYLTLLAHQRNREHQAAVLRQQTLLLSSNLDPLPPVLPPTRAERAIIDRATLTEAAKDRWNAEIEHAVRWAQQKDWAEVREGLETAVARLLGYGIEATQDGAERTQEKGAAVARDAWRKSTNAAADKTEGVAAAAKTAYADAKAKSADLANKSETAADEAKGGLASAIGRGFEKGREVFGKAKSAVVSAGEDVGKTAAGATTTLSPVEKALQQRYDGQPSAALDQTVEEVLAKRYTPAEQKNNTDLKVI